MKWVKGEPEMPGWYLLEFSGGIKHLVVHAFYDDENIFRLEEQQDYGYVSDCVDVIVCHLPIPKPLAVPNQ